jgi:hypothetical protein
VQLLVLAFEAALYPTLLAAVVILLSQPRRLRLLATYLAGGLTISIGLGLVLVFVVQGSSALSSNKSGLSWGADLAIGGLALLVAVALATGSDERLRARRAKHKEPPSHAAEKRDPWSQRILARGSAPIVFLAAMAINVPGAAYLIALKDIAQDNHSAGTDVLLIVGFNLIMFLLAEIPLVGLLLAPERTDALVTRMNQWLSRNGRRIAIVISAVLGIFLLVRGIANA